MQEEPLHLIPHDLRADVEKEFGLYIEGELCPHCRYMVDTQYKGHIEDVPVKRLAFSEKYRVGVGTFTPSDPKSQDISELVGGIDLSTIGEVGVESDPRAYRFDGELNIANRGIMEFVEMLKCISGNSLIFTQEGIRRIGSFAQPSHPAGESREIAMQLLTVPGSKRQLLPSMPAFLRPNRFPPPGAYFSKELLDTAFPPATKNGVQFCRGL